MADYNGNMNAGGIEELDLIFFGGWPEYFTEAQIREFMESFGKLEFFNVIKDRVTGNHKGYGFLAYHNPLVADSVITCLNGFRLRDGILSAKHVNQLSTSSNSHGVDSLVQPMNNCRL